MLQPESKTLAIVFYILAVVLDPVLPLWRIVGYLLFLLFFAVLSRASILKIIKRSFFLIPFLLVILIFNALPGGVGPRVYLLLGKGWLAAFGLAALAVSTDFVRLIKGLQRLGLPNVLIQLLTFMYRYLDLLVAEVRRMEIARNQRFFGRGYLRQFTVLGNMLGNLFLRTFERGERVYVAMQLRGFQGYLPITKVAYSWQDYCLVIGALATLALLGVSIICPY